LSKQSHHYTLELSIQDIYLAVSSGGEGMSPVQGEAIRRRYIKPEYLPI